MDMFTAATMPARLKNNSLAHKSTWLTWSPAFRALMKRLRALGALAQPVRLTRVPACAPYDKTYTTRYKTLAAAMKEQLQAFLPSLMAQQCGAKAVFFRRMLSPDFTTTEIRALFALLREAIIAQENNPAAALYSPVSPEKNDPGFNLHADLFLTTKLWLIFDDVPEDGTGASLFLSRKKLLANMQSVKGVPKKSHEAVASLLDLPLAKDSYNKMYDLIYDHRNAWCDRLQQAMTRDTQAVCFNRGEGYLVDDRNWLHGRSAVSRSVTANRFHRLTFDLVRDYSAKKKKS
jgi:hypothetical protein